MSPHWRKAIAALEIVGGLVGGFVVVARLGPQPTPAALAIGAAFFVVFLLAILAGVMLWRDTRLGRILSIVVQFAQLPKVWSVPFAFTVGFVGRVLGPFKHAWVIPFVERPAVAMN